MTETGQYLLVLYLAEREREGPIPTGYVASELERSPAAATEMVQRLAERGLVTHERYEGATLTEEGRTTARELFETYETLARFFRDVLELEDHEAEAMEVAGSVSPLVVERLATTLLDEDDASTREGSVSSCSRHDSS